MTKEVETKPDLPFVCEGCKTRYAEYINGCPRCWINDLSDEENRMIFPRRGVVLLKDLHD